MYICIYLFINYVYIYSHLPQAPGLYLGYAAQPFSGVAQVCIYIFVDIYIDIDIDIDTDVYTCI